MEDGREGRERWCEGGIEREWRKGGRIEEGNERGRDGAGEKGGRKRAEEEGIVEGREQRSEWDEQFREGAMEERMREGARDGGIFQGRYPEEDNDPYTAHKTTHHPALILDTSCERVRKLCIVMVVLYSSNDRWMRWFYVMAIMDWVHMAWTWCIIGNPSKAM